MVWSAVIVANSAGTCPSHRSPTVNQSTRKAVTDGSRRHTLTMDTPAAVARERVVVGTIADLIVAAAAGRTLRVGVAWTQPAQGAFVELLNRALHDRGRACRSLAPKNHPVAGDASGRAHSAAGGPAVAVITSGITDPDDKELCRIDVELHSLVQSAAPVAPACQGHDRQGTCSAGDRQPDVIVDYLDPAGPTIRHIRLGLTPQHHRHQPTSSPSDRRVGPP
jgi:hypothetical protein